MKLWGFHLCKCSEHQLAAWKRFCLKKHSEPVAGGDNPKCTKLIYWMVYGDYLIGLNTTETDTYDLPTPATRRSYFNLVTRKSVVPVNGAVKVPPRSTVVLYLGK